MRLLPHVTKWLAHAGERVRSRRQRARLECARRCSFEPMEPRQLLAASPLVVGAVYIEEDTGSDLHGDTFEITFLGGAPGTELTRLEIDTDRSPLGLGRGDLIFDTEMGGYGADLASPFTVVSWQTQDPQATVTAFVEDGSTLLMLQLSGFRAGDKLVFSIDVDEIEQFDPEETDFDLINEGIDPITSGVEFQGSWLRVAFSAPHYYEAEVAAEFRNAYDNRLEGTGLDLPADDAGGKRDRTAGAVGHGQQQPLPVALAGTVYLESNLDLIRQTGEPGLADVELTLWRKVGESYESTGHRTRTDAHGNYEFGTDLKLPPGVYQIRETQPAGLFSVGAIPGRIDGRSVGQVIANNPDILTEIVIELGAQRAEQLNFAEARPAELQGYVYHDRSNDGRRDPGEQGIGGVSVRAIPVNTIAAQGPVSVVTDASGFYRVTGLAPGSYRLIQVAQPAGYFDGLDTAGTVAGQPSGRAINPGDSIEDIFLGGGQVGSEYNFGELLPASLAGHVWLADADGRCDLGPGVARPVAGAEVQLWDASGQLLITNTDAAGRYRFDNLWPGIYSIIEVTPEGLIDGSAHVGRVDGSSIGSAVDGALVDIVIGSGQAGTDYDFCEYEPASLSGRVYHDRNNDGTPSAGEEGLPGVQVRLLDSAGNEVRATLTDSQGRYEFSGLHAGVYTIVETQPEGWVDGLDRAGTVGGVIVGQAINPGDRIEQVRLRWGEQGVNYLFGEFRYASITGRVQLTTPDGDCYATEDQFRPVVGATVQLQNDSGVTIAQTTSDAQGRYRFDGLLPGVYGLVELTPAGLIDGPEHLGTVAGQRVGRLEADAIRDLLLSSAQEAIDYDFCEYEPASLSGYVYHDRDNDGIFDAGDPVIAGVSVQLRDALGQTIATTVTAENGSYTFSGLRAGVYTLIEIQPEGYLDGLDTPGSTSAGPTGRAINPGDEIRDIQLRWGDEGQDFNFGELMTGSLAGRVHADRNGNCQLDEGEWPLAGVTLDLLDADGQRIATTRTDSQGRYRFDDLPPGVYTIQEQQPAGYFQGSQRAGSGGGDDSLDDVISQIALGSGRELVDYDFCEIPPADLQGRVHLDLNDNQQLDDDEPPLAGVTLHLLNSSGARVATTTTDADGRYRFENLPPGTYAVQQVQPGEYFDGGQRAGSHGGNSQAVNRISATGVPAGDSLVDYDFWEIPPASLAGRVHLDLNENGRLDDGEAPLAGVTLRLLDASGRTVATTTTDAQGRYRFEHLPPGTYAVQQVQPQEYFDGGHRAGSHGGDTGVANLIGAIRIPAGRQLLDYDFWEVPPASLAGQVYVDTNQNCQRDADELPLSGVIVRLLDSAGNVAATAHTDAAGQYRFDKLRPAMYSVQQVQPAGYFQGSQRAGSHGGNAETADLISSILVPAGQALVGYDFCEVPPAGVSGYVFQDGPTIATLLGQPLSDLSLVRDGQRTPDDTPLAGVTVQLLDAATGQPIRGDSDRVLPGSYADGPITAVTDARGYYRFHGLLPGTYVVHEIQPAGYLDGIDTPGPLSAALYPQGVERQTLIPWAWYPENSDGDVLLVRAAAGRDSPENNFSELLTAPIVFPVEDQPPYDPPPIIAAQPVTPLEVAPLIAAPLVPPPLRFTSGRGGRLDFAWHLSVIDAGAPRGTSGALQLEGLPWRNAALRPPQPWNELSLTEGRWTLRITPAPDDKSPAEIRHRLFGMRGAIPVVGDFNGDGVDEMGIYYRGHWLLDLNGDGCWDDEDLWAQLGTEVDRPVTGDWNGDGKADIGIFGPSWEGDDRALQVEYGLPAARNKTVPVSRPKNVPPEVEDATSGFRFLQHTVRGQVRADVIDHVFRYGSSSHIPISGDWTGDGIKKIGVFTDGRWQLDVDGNGRWSEGDWDFQYGQPGDLPIVGDFNGDGVDEIGVYRQGQWIIDLDGNRQLDPHDHLFQLGGPGDTPVVGDFNGDGIADAAVYNADG